MLSGGGGLITIIDSASVDLTVGDSVTISASINENQNELNPSDNTTILREEIVGAIDPNDILVTPRGEGEYHYIEKEQTLTYKIRFQNVGTYYAQHVEVSNIIPYNLDLNTLEITQLSHETHYVREGNTIVWSFKDICLPDSNQNEALSHGFIEYKIKPLNSVGYGDVILNQAEIKFDFESPIKTNIAFSSIKPEPEEFGLINIYPNPMLTKTMLSIETQRKTNYYLVVVNQMGQEVYNSFIGLKKGMNSVSLDLSEIPPGVYTVCLKGTLATFTGKLIKQ
ncbi:MAG: T9SS type A sorting domain-containing protein [Vicingaceae bacterium]